MLGIYILHRNCPHNRLTKVVPPVLANPAVCAFIEAQITELVRIGTEHGEETTKTWILNMARELQARDTLGEGWF